MQMSWRLPLLMLVPPMVGVDVHVVMSFVSLIPLTLDRMPPIRIIGIWLGVTCPPPLRRECLLPDLCMEAFPEGPSGTTAARRDRGTSDF